MREVRPKPAVLAWLETLEERCLLTVDWTGAGDGVSWGDPANWNTDAVPVATDDVVINPGTTSSIVISASTGDVTVHSLTGSDALEINGSNLTVTSTSTITGALTIDGGGLIATGAATTLTASGATTATSGSLDANSGAALDLSGLSTISDSNNLSIAADGAGSAVALANLTTFTSYYQSSTLSATNGGLV
ncbi:MAG: hypothetical protein KGM43_05145, partial [Planctomycetota bacterium]|nr:hypothetical protein [Planctomycetota bacterium]